MASGLTNIPGIKVGVAHNRNAATGVTVVLVEDGARAAVEVRGSAPGTRETDLLMPGCLVEEVQGLVLAGGSAYGLEAASGVMEYLEKNNLGFQVDRFKVPIVPAAVLFDLLVGDGNIRPGREMGFEACANASTGPVPEGSVGAGCGATVGKIYGAGNAIKSGQGSFACHNGDLIVAALVAVNAFGDVYDQKGVLMAGPRNPHSGEMEKTATRLTENGMQGGLSNTTLGIIGTNAAFNKLLLQKVCQLAHNGLARSIWPVHTMWDGDAIFAISKGDVNADVNVVGIMAAEAISRAVERAITEAESICGVPAAADLST